MENLGTTRDRGVLGLVSPWSAFWSLVLVGVCVGGDRVLDLPQISQNMYARALTDSCTHGLVGVVSWLVVVSPVSWRFSVVPESFLCGFLACTVDLDHFLMAKSFHLKDALSLPKRPPFHNTLLIAPVALGIYTAQRLLRASRLQDLPIFFMVAWLSHHVRDANRRGLWFGPLGHTSPLPQPVYVLVTLCLPWSVRGLSVLLADKLVTKESVTSSLDV